MTLPHAAVKNPTKEQLKVQIAVLQHDYNEAVRVSQIKSARIDELDAIIEAKKTNYADLVSQHNALIDAVHAEREAFNDKIALFGEQRLEAIRERNDWKTKAELREKQAFQALANGKSKLMSMVYALDMITDASTHHEKEVIVRHMKTTFTAKANAPDVLPSDEMPELPF